MAARSNAFISFIAAERPALTGKPSDGCPNDQSSRPADRYPTDPVAGSGSYDDHLGRNLPARSRIRGTQARRAATRIARPPYARLRGLVGAARGEHPFSAQAADVALADRPQLSRIRYEIRMGGPSSFSLGNSCFGA